VRKIIRLEKVCEHTFVEKGKSLGKLSGKIPKKISKQKFVRKI
jgi:hypothetical protein